MNPAKFAIEVDWERLENGSPEERAAFGAIGIRVDEKWLTEAHDTFVKRVRQSVHLSGYLLAQWFAWNWWRLRWEPERRSIDWRMSHRMSTIGGGYVWPNVDCASDGKRVMLLARPASPRVAEPLRYVADVVEAFSVSEFEFGVEQFVELVLEQLRTEGIRKSNLERIWACVSEERRDPEADWYRRLEAALGYDPDEADEKKVTALIAEVDALGKNGVAELAAGASLETDALNAKKLWELAKKEGDDACFADIPRIPDRVLNPQSATTPAWVVGKEAARKLRDQEKLGGGPLSDENLAKLAGTRSEILKGGSTGEMSFSYALNGNGETARIVLQSPIATNRRFALARFIGDRILEKTEESFIPIMRSYSYRQKLQRSFAAEFLCPFDEANTLLDSEFSEESQERVADKYMVSPMLVQTQLVNKGFLERETLDRF